MQVLCLGTLYYDGMEDFIQVTTSTSRAGSRYLPSIAIIERPGYAQHNAVWSTCYNRSCPGYNVLGLCYVCQG